MAAVFMHELRGLFGSLTAYLFGAFLLAFVGLGAMIYNLQAAVSNFEYVLSFGSVILTVIVPVLTMRTIAEEKRQHTDQLLRALPLTSAGVVLGKYLALLVVCAIPMGLICLYPLIFANFGEVYLPASYGAMLAFYLLVAALVALGVFLSSLTEHQGLAAGLGIALMLLNYYSVTLSQLLAGSALGALAALFVLILAGSILLRWLTGSEALGFGAGLAAMLAAAAAFWYNSAWFEGLAPRVLAALSLFARFESFVNGVFDLKAVLFYISFAVFFLFLAVQSLEKRRYH